MNSNKKKSYIPNTFEGAWIKEKPVMKVELAGLRPIFPRIKDDGTVDIPILASTAKPPC